MFPPPFYRCRRLQMIFKLINCDMSADCSDITFDFSLPYEMVDDRDILNSMNIGRTNIEYFSKALPTKMLIFSLKNRLLDHLNIGQDLYHYFNNKLTDIQSPVGFIPDPTCLLAK